MKIKFYNSNEKKSEGIIFPQQTHSTNIVEIKTGKENLENCDGIFTDMKNDFSLGVVTADCGAITFYDYEKYGVTHAGWRGLVDGILEKMSEKFDNTEIFVAPFYHIFEITKNDDCFNRIKKKFGEEFFEKHQSDKKVYFNFKEAMKKVLGGNAEFDNRNTFFDKSLASWRRDKTDKRNFTVISKT